MNIWDFFVWFFWVYIFFSCIFIFITVFIDVFRDHGLSGWAKAAWIIFLIAVPFLAAFIYLIARSKSMSERGAAAQREAQAGQAAYIRSVAGGGGSGASSEIESAKALLDAGTITDAEFKALKAKALA